MRHTNHPSTPRCPSCNGRHYPATLGNGNRVWCNGAPVDTRAEIRTAIAREHALRSRETIRQERLERASSAPPIEAWERARVPDTLPDAL